MPSARWHAPGKEMRLCPRESIRSAGCSLRVLPRETIRLLPIRLRSRDSFSRNSFLASSVEIACKPSSPMAFPEMSTSTKRDPRERREATDRAPSALSRQSIRWSLSSPAPSMRAPRATKAAPQLPRQTPCRERDSKLDRLVASSMQNSARWSREAGCTVSDRPSGSALVGGHASVSTPRDSSKLFPLKVSISTMVRAAMMPRSRPPLALCLPSPPFPSLALSFSNFLQSDENPHVASSRASSACFRNAGMALSPGSRRFA
mmetsp:Transcript_74263/g.147571  ORF Transcript_74263/g.147571 Transcript_74263/m.147571 type:complete len:261 (-) Transcript_74263:547-1329(-)